MRSVCKRDIGEEYHSDFWRQADIYRSAVCVDFKATSTSLFAYKSSGYLLFCEYRTLQHLETGRSVLCKVFPVLVRNFAEMMSIGC